MILITIIITIIISHRLLLGMTVSGKTNHFFIEFETISTVGNVHLILSINLLKVYDGKVYAAAY